MSIHSTDSESYPAGSFSISQLLYATKRKLQGATTGGRVATTMDQAEVGSLEQDVREVLSLVLSMRNTFAPINHIPQDILSIIPGYCSVQELVMLTHVCHGWREQFISCPSLWTSLDCRDVDQTYTYLERSRASPLEICVDEECGYSPFLTNAFLLTVPHLNRVKSLSLAGGSDTIRQLTHYLLNWRAPLLERLRIYSSSGVPMHPGAPILSGALPLLRTLCLSVAFTDLPWRGMAGLTSFDLTAPYQTISVTQFLDFFESTPALRDIALSKALPYISDAPPGRLVSIPHLRSLDIAAQPPNSTLLNHLLIPHGAFLSLQFEYFNDEEFPIPIHLPQSFDSLGNLTTITSINLDFTDGMRFRLEGPSGRIHVSGIWNGVPDLQPVANNRALGSLTTHFNISTTKRLAVMRYFSQPVPEMEDSSAYQTLLAMSDLHTLTLRDCPDLTFICALNPSRTPSRTVVCPRLRELALHIGVDGVGSYVDVDELLDMARERSKRGVGLLGVVLICTQEIVPAKEVGKLKPHVSSVEYRLDEAVPDWDYIPNGVDDISYETDSFD